MNLIRRFLTFFVPVALCLSASAGERITATITFTNTPAFPNTVTVNGNVRTWTNNASGNPAGTITIGADRLISATNYANQIFLAPYSGAVVASFNSGSNVVLTAQPDQAITVSFSGTYARVSYSTQAVASAVGVRIPISGEASPAQRTNISSGLVDGINSYSSSVLHQAAPAMAELLGTTNAQTVSGAKQFTGVNTHSNSYWFNGVLSNAVALQLSGIISNATVLFSRLTNGSLHGFNVGTLTNGYWTNGILVSPKFTNAVNYGSSFSSIGTAALSEQFGASAQATNTSAIAFGYTAVAGGGSSIAFGAYTVATGENAVTFGTSSQSTGLGSTAIGNGSGVSAESGTAIGRSSGVDAPSGTALGAFAYVDNLHTNSTAIGTGALTTDKNQIMLGTADVSTYVNSFLQVGVAATNITFAGTNNWRGDIAFKSASNSGLANGNNSGVVLGTNVFVKLSGASTVANIAGFAAERDGSYHIVKISGSVTNNILDASGLEATAANRIVTGTGGTIISTNSPTWLELVYDGTAARWNLLSIR